MKILILGGTSFFGKAIVRQLHAAGHSLTLFTRGNRNPAELPPHTHILGDRNQKKDLAKAKGPWDVVIDNIAYQGEQVHAALQTVACSHYFLTSTISVYRYVPEGEKAPLREGDVDFNFHPKEEDLSDEHWAYARGKLEAERVLRSEAKIPWTIFRPTIVFGPDDVKGRSYWYWERLRGEQPILLPNGGGNRFKLVYSEDVARAYVAAIGNRGARGKAYNLAQSETLTLKGFVEDCAKLLKVTPTYVNTPWEKAGELGGPFAMRRDWIPDTSAAQRDLAFKPTPWPDFARTTYDWFS